MPTLILEIGTEEIPARFMENSLAELKTIASKEFAEARLTYSSLATYGTPRRLVVEIKDLAVKQSDLFKEIKGPAQKAAYDNEGNPTKALQGFMKSQGVSLEDLELREVGNASYVYAKKEEAGQETRAVLPKLLPQIIAKLNFPKPMHWGYEEVKFVRPIRWILAMIDDKAIDFTYAGVNSGRYTYGHRSLSQGAIFLGHAEEYFKKLKEGFCLVKQEERKEIISWQIEAQANRVGGKVVPDPKLLEEITQLVEFPTALLGEYPYEFLTLPQEVLITTMKENQKYFPVIAEITGKLMNKFITVRNGSIEHLDNVRLGNEKVLVARLADANFFFTEDKKTPLKEKRAKLENVVFQESLGTLGTKIERIKEIAIYLGKIQNCDEPTLKLIEETALLAKADLASSMVYEFPELQGIMGYYYAKAEGYDELIAEGIKEHYLPKFAGDAVARTITGKCVSIADKIDTIVGCFGVGLIPTGSQDPYALRRQALGICHTIIENEMEISLQELVRMVAPLYGAKISRNQSELEESIISFFKQRVQNILEDRKIRYDLIDAILSIELDDISNTVKRADALATFAAKDEFLSLATLFTRAANLTKNTEPVAINTGDFVEEVEKELYQSLQEVKTQVETALEEKKYLEALEYISTLRIPVDNFFNGVMVMAEDLNLKNNRLALLQGVVALTSKIANLAKIAIK